MSTLAEIEVAVHALPVEQKRALYEFLASELAQSEPAGHGVMDIPVVDLGDLPWHGTCSVRDERNKVPFHIKSSAAAE